MISVPAIFDFMSTLKMVLHVEKTLKTTIQKKLRKSQKFTRKISVVEFHYSQNIFLRFTVTLFHSNLDEKITSNEQKITSNEQRAKSNEQRAKSSTSFRAQSKIYDGAFCENS